VLSTGPRGIRRGDCCRSADCLSTERHRSTTGISQLFGRDDRLDSRSRCRVHWRREARRLVEEEFRPIPFRFVDRPVSRLFCGQYARHHSRPWRDGSADPAAGQPQAVFRSPGPLLTGNAAHAYTTLTAARNSRLISKSPRQASGRITAEIRNSPTASSARSFRLGQNAERKGRMSLAKLHYRMAAKLGSARARDKMADLKAHGLR